MRSRLPHRFFRLSALSSALMATALACTIASAGAAQQRAVRNPGLISAPPLTPPIAPQISTGINTSGHNQPGVPNTSTPGIIGTGAKPSGLRGDSPAAPGFPATGQR